MGDRTTTDAYHLPDLALGDQTLCPILSMYNYSLPRCYTDWTVKKRWQCPEYEQPSWHEGLSGPERNDTRILLRDPRDGPELPFARLGMATWSIKNDTRHLAEPDWADRTPVSPLHGCLCPSMKACWEDVFLRRYHKKAPRGEAQLMTMVKLFNHGAELEAKSRHELQSSRDTYFH